MKVYLDDARPAPVGWIRTKTVDETIHLLNAAIVTEVSLDHDLGTSETGYDVLTWIEKKVRMENFRPPIMHVHSQNPVGKKRMEAAIEAINK